MQPLQLNSKDISRNASELTAKGSKYNSKQLVKMRRFYHRFWNTIHHERPSYQECCWWSPSQNSLPVQFCQNTSIHGLAFIGRPKLHLSERIFWSVAFVLGVVAAVLLINNVWERYYQNPVIVTFQESTMPISTIPFPSVTLCNMNAFPKSKVKLLQEAAEATGTVESARAREALKFVRNVCNSRQSFAKEFNFAVSRGDDDNASGWNETISEDSQDEMMDFLYDQTIPCEDLIRLCSFGEETVNCKNIFKPVITDYGKCCTFNILPLPLLFNNPQKEEGDPTSSINPALGTKQRWTEEEINIWRLWNYDKDGFYLLDKTLPRPYRQGRAGLPYGLSILIDPNLDDLYCPISDSEGLRFVLLNSLEMPHVHEFGSLLEAGKEIFIKVYPDMTSAEDNIRDIRQDLRNCYFPEERQLEAPTWSFLVLTQFYPLIIPGGNCVDECTALVLEIRCNCTYFYLPRENGVRICNTDPDSPDFHCIDNAKVDLLETLKEECAHCESLCENIEYHFEATQASLQNSSELWFDPDTDVLTGIPDWASNKMSIVHIFLAEPTIVPKVRKRLYGVTDLIANTGGLLGLCLGFSILSGVELVYFLTLRAFWQLCWVKILKSKGIRSGTKKRKRSISQKGPDKVIQLDAREIPCIPRQLPLQREYHPASRIMTQRV